MVEDAAAARPAAKKPRLANEIEEVEKKLKDAIENKVKLVKTTEELKTQLTVLKIEALNQRMADAREVQEKIEKLQLKAKSVVQKADQAAKQLDKDIQARKHLLQKSEIFDDDNMKKLTEKIRRSKQELLKQLGERAKLLNQKSEATKKDLVKLAEEKEDLQKADAFLDDNTMQKLGEEIEKLKQTLETGDNDDNDEIIMTKSMWECIICSVLPSDGSIWSCSSCDQVICNGCKLQLQACPTCRAGVGENPLRRNRMVERFLEGSRQNVAQSDV